MKQILDVLINTVGSMYKSAGLAVVLVKDGNVVLKETYGYADIESQKPITENTFFDIASCSKAFTNFALAIEKQMGTFDWDTPIRNYNTDITFFDSYTDTHVTAKDMATHRTGLPRHDLIDFDVMSDREEYVSRLGYLKPNAGFRERFQYQNQVYAALGRLLENINGQTWEQSVKKNIAEKIGMDIHYRGEDMNGLDYCKPYLGEGPNVKKIPYNTNSANNPCGGIKTNINGLEKWLKLLIGQGSFEGEEIISKENFEELIKSYITVDDNKSYGKDNITSYGLGWFTSIDRGHKVVSHGGAIDGFSSSVGFIPELNSGYAILCNTLGGPITSILEYVLVDVLTDNIKDDYQSFFMEHLMPKPKEEAEKEELNKKEATHQLSDFAGTYYDKGYGKIVISENDGNLFAEYGTLKLPLEHYNLNTYTAQVPILGIKLTLNFASDMMGSVNKIDAEAFAGNTAQIKFDRI